ncbi:hypothetical protein Cgig2_013810 [Carnegiea gigantea]|uniref:Uncharacterized protein n=1 Tax=Carnegiea gigantea TaxID=171969 RepID=A0A9Q1JK61_9CARY|nr:hypothetical protein Cgig2_013810 [Carnegiea gigantea]
MTLANKTIRKKEERIKVIRWTSVLRKMRKELGVSTLPYENILMEIKNNPTLPIETPIKFKNKNKYCKYRKDYRHTTSERRKLKKALTRDKVGIAIIEIRKERKKENEADCNTEIITTIIGGIDDKELNVMAAIELKLLVGLDMMFGPEDMHPLQTPQNNALDNSRIVETNFLVVDIPMAYDVILERSSRNAIKAVLAPYFLLIQFELDDGKVWKLYETQRW